MHASNVHVCGMYEAMYVNVSVRLYRVVLEVL